MVVSLKLVHPKCMLVTEVTCVDIVWSLKSTVHRVTLRVCHLDLDEYIKELYLSLLYQIVVSLLEKPSCPSCLEFVHSLWEYYH